MLCDSCQCDTSTLPRPECFASTDSQSVGLFEAGHFPAVMYVASSYYKPHELARRNTIIQVFTSVGPLFSGFLMWVTHRLDPSIHVVRCLSGS